MKNVKNNFFGGYLFTNLLLRNCSPVYCIVYISDPGVIFSGGLTNLNCCPCKRGILKSIYKTQHKWATVYASQNKFVKQRQLAIFMLSKCQIPPKSKWY